MGRKLNARWFDISNKWRLATPSVGEDDDEDEIKEVKMSRAVSKIKSSEDSKDLVETETVVKKPRFRKNKLTKLQRKLTHVEEVRRPVQKIILDTIDEYTKKYNNDGVHEHTIYVPPVKVVPKRPSNVTVAAIPTIRVGVLTPAGQRANFHLSFYGIDSHLLWQTEEGARLRKEALRKRNLVGYQTVPY